MREWTEKITPHRTERGADANHSSVSCGLRANTEQTRSVASSGAEGTDGYVRVRQAHGWRGQTGTGDMWAAPHEAETDREASGRGCRNEGPELRVCS